MRYLGLLSLVLLIGCSSTNNYYDKEQLEYCPPEYKTVEEVHFYKGVFVYKDKRGEFPMVGEKGWERNQWNGMVSDDCSEECNGGSTTWAYISDLIICACAEHNLSNITDKTGWER